MPADEPQIAVCHHRPREQPSLGEDLEPIADAEDRRPARGEPFHLLHHRGEAGDGSGAQVVAVGEAPGKDDTVGPREVGLAVKHQFRLCPKRRNA